MKQNIKAFFKIDDTRDLSKAHLIFWVSWTIISAFLIFSFRENYTIALFLIRLFCANIVFFYTVYFALQLSKKGNTVNYLLRIVLLTVSMAISYFATWAYYTYIVPITKELPAASINSEVIFLGFITNYLYFFLFGLMFYFFESLIKKNEETKAVEKRRLEAETAFLRAQINPHFLLNTLNFFYAGALMGKSKELADGILKLSDIMRFSLTKNSDKLIALKDEVRFIRSYAELNQMRFNNELSAVIELPTEDQLSHCKIIPLVLITLVENAFKHGELLDKEHPVVISLTINKTEGYLKFCTRNKKRQGPKEDGHGIGIENTIARLEAEYGNQYKLTFNDDGWFYEAILEIWSPAIAHNLKTEV